MLRKTARNKLRQKRHDRIRNHVMGTPERPRMTVFRSNKHIYVQIIDDVAQHTLVSACTLAPELAGQYDVSGNAEAAAAVGKLVAEKALAKGIEKVVFDRGGYKYHGRVAALAAAAREAGLDF